MKATMKINFSSKSIEMTQTTLKRASQYGTPEYHELRAILKDFPDYQVEVIRRAAPTSFSGLTYATMETYISFTGDAAAQEEFRQLRSLGANYARVKQWFMMRFPEFCTPAA